MSDIASRVKAIIVDKLGVDESEVTPEASFTNDLGADSLDTVELIMEFEKEFNIGIPDDQAESISTVGEAIKYIEDNKQGILRIYIKYTRDNKSVIGGIRRVSKPSLRVHTPHKRLPRVLGRYGIAIVSTSQGILTDTECRQRGIGGEILCEVW